jgi:uncharacterized membrane protein YfcA
MLLMDNTAILICAGFLIGALGTLIGAGGGFILVPLLIITHPGFSPEVITAISIAIVGSNAVSGSVAYARLGRNDYKAGLVFAVVTIPGSIMGVYTTQYIPSFIFHTVFGLILILLAAFLFFKRQPVEISVKPSATRNNWKHRVMKDREGNVYSYSYDQNIGMLISVVVGYLSPVLGIGGGIIHVPALVNWLRFPVHIATATSHFILAIMATVSVIVHIINGNYNDPIVLRMVILLGIGVIAGAQLGAFLSHKIKGRMIVRALAICLAIVGLRILLF